MTWIPRKPQIFILRILEFSGCHIGLFALSREYLRGELLVLHSYLHQVCSKNRNLFAADKSLCVALFCLPFSLSCNELAGDIRSDNFKSIPAK